MEKLFHVAAVIVPIFVTVYCGMVARKKAWITPEGVQGLQQFVVSIALPCLIFNSVLTAKVGAESLAIMALQLPFVLGVMVWAFKIGRKKYPYQNLPMMFGAQESGMLGIPLFLILFGSVDVYHMVILDLTQAIVGYPTIAILTCETGDSPKPAEVLKRILTSPLVIACLLALGLNLSGAGAMLLESGVGQVITEAAAFLGQPVSTLMIFSVGYNLSLSKENRGEIFKLCLVRLLTFAAICGALQLLLFLIPNITALTRWAVLLYWFLPASYLAPSLGKTEREQTVASGVSSLLTAVTLVVFCAMAALIA